MFGEQEAVVLSVKPFGLHGLTYYDVTVMFSDRTVEQARLGPEGVPPDLQPEEAVRRYFEDPRFDQTDWSVFELK